MLRKHSKILIKQIKNKNYTFIDYCLIAFAIFVLSFLAYTSLIRKTAPLFVDLTFQRQKYFDTPIPPEYWQVDNIKAGDVAYNSLGNKIAEVVEVEKSYWNGGSRKNILITLQLKAQYHKKTKQFSLDDNPLLIGRDLTFNLGSTEFTGQIINLYQDQEDRFSLFNKAKAEIKVKYREYEPWHAESIKDLKVVNSQNETILIAKKAIIEPAEIAVETASGAIVKRRHPIKKDVTVTFELPQVLCLEKICYYKNFQTFLIGSQFWADSGYTYVGPRSSIMEVNIFYQE